MTDKNEIRGVARHLRLVCTEQIEELEDQLPRVTNPQDREDRDFARNGRRDQSTCRVSNRGV
jgi:hypothetical protein